MNIYVKIIFATSISLILISGHENNLSALSQSAQTTIDIAFCAQNSPTQKEIYLNNQKAILIEAESAMENYFNSISLSHNPDEGILPNPIFVGCKLEQLNNDYGQFSIWAKKSKLMIMFDIKNPAPVAERLLCPKNFKNFPDLLCQALASEPFYEQEQTNVSQVLACLSHKNIGLIKTIENTKELLNKQLVDHSKEIMHDKKNSLKTHCKLKVLSLCKKIKNEANVNNFLLLKKLFKLKFEQIEINPHYSFLSLSINYNNNSEKFSMTTSVLTLEEDLKKILLGEIKPVPLY